jgi:calmodulin
MGMNANKEDITAMVNAFNEIDTNHDGVITYEDLQQVKSKKISGERWIQIFRECDLDGDGRIDFEEFMSAAVD